MAYYLTMNHLEEEENLFLKRFVKVQLIVLKMVKLSIGKSGLKKRLGHAKDYVEAMHKIVQHEKPLDIVIATGKTYSVRDLCFLAFKYNGIDIEFTGKGMQEVAIVKKIDTSINTPLRLGDKVIEVNEKFYGPSDVELLLGDASMAKAILNWEPKINFKMLIKEMVEACKG